MIKTIGLETSSIMPLMETTTRTLPLQKKIKEIIEEYEVKFYTDLHSIKEATQQINTSYNNAIKSVEKALIVAERLNTNDPVSLTVIFIKSLSENWYGREETLRWSDIVTCDKLKHTQTYKDFFETVKKELENKKEKYLSMLVIENQYLDIDCKYIQSYWITPLFVRDTHIKIEVITNNISVENFFQKLQSVMNTAYMGTLKINDVVDIYHLYSLYNDANITEVWSCNQQFVKRHKKYLQSVDEFKDLFNKNIVTIKRIK